MTPQNPADGDRTAALRDVGSLLAALSDFTKEIPARFPLPCPNHLESLQDSGQTPCGWGLAKETAGDLLRR